ncbi:Macrolide export protein MacA [bacterium HR09]|nr:Macrolide export protein MacA [bacterium HR09]
MHRLWVALGIVGLVACGGGQEGAPKGPQPVRVKVMAVKPEVLEVRATAVGTVEPEHKVLVAAQEEGVVTELLVREGDRVTEGQLIARLDDRELLAQLEEAEARLAEASGQWQRAQSLVKEGLITAAEADAARASFQVAQARVSALRTRLSFTRITAPVAGVVTTRHVEIGSLVSSRSPVVELAAGRMVLRVPVSELDVVKLKVGDKASVLVDALAGTTIPARIERIFPAADPASRQVTVELVLEEVPPGLRPGFLARAELLLERIPAALLVPETVVMRGSEFPSFVYVVEGGVARVRPVQVTLRQGGKARVSSGLAVGDQVVVEGASLLRDGQPVVVEGEA